MMLSMHGQLLLLGVKGLELSPEEITLFKKIQPGGFVIFGRNVQSPQQVRALTDSLKDLCDIELVLVDRSTAGLQSRPAAGGVALSPSHAE